MTLGGAMGFGSRNLTPAMRAMLGPEHVILAKRLESVWRKKQGSDRARFSFGDVNPPHDIAQEDLDRLVALGILGRVNYASGAYQYCFTPFTRTWFFGVQAQPVAT